MKRLLALLLLPLMLLGLRDARAQGLEIDIVNGNAAALPIAVVPMDYLGANAAPDTDVAAVIRADLNRSGAFRTLPDRDVIEKPQRGSDVDFATWRLLKQDFLLIGRTIDAADGGFTTEFELYDVAKQEALLRSSVNRRVAALGA